MIFLCKHSSLRMFFLVMFLAVYFGGHNFNPIMSQESRIWVNNWDMKLSEGVLDVEKTRATIAADIPTKVFLTNGERLAFTELAVSDREFVVEALRIYPRFLRKYAFIVTSVGYDEMQPIESIDNDGKAFYDLVTGKLGFDKEDVVYLRNDKNFNVYPTKRKIETEFRKFTSRLEPNSFVLIYFAGYGYRNLSTNENFFLGCDTETDNIAETSVSLNKLFKSIYENDVRITPWVVVDICQEDEGINEVFDDYLPTDNGKTEYVFMQSRGKDGSTITNDECGLFTRALLEAFFEECDDNKDGVTSLEEIWKYTLTRTQEISKDKVVPRLLTYGCDTEKFLISNASSSSKVYQNPYGMKFNLIPAGSFMMGDSLSPEENVKLWGGTKDLYEGDDVQHEVTISHDFYMSAYEVTKGEFKRFIDETGFKTTAEKEGTAKGFDDSGRWDSYNDMNWSNPGFSQTERDPVVCVSYDDALEFIAWLNNTDYSIPLGFCYALPTEAEWEYACRCGGQDSFFWGPSVDDGKDYVNAAGEDKTPWGTISARTFPFSDGFTFTCPVDCSTFKPNRYGLYHMLGNVAEWCYDWIAEYSAEAVIDPLGPKIAESRVIRGGGWLNEPLSCRSSFRISANPTESYSHVGFRLALVSKNSRPQTKPQISTEGRFNFIE